MHAPALPIIPSDLLLLAYRNGIFPMSDGRDDPEVFWVEPKHRAILPLDGFRLSRSLAKVVRKERFAVTCDAAFDRVVPAAWTVVGEFRWASLTASSREIGRATESALT